MRWPYKGLRIEWYGEKNTELTRSRGISFEDVVLAIEEGLVLEIVPHWSKGQYAHQQAIVVVLNGYVHVVPCVIDEEKVFLKTIFPSRKIAKKYLPDSIK